ncbi:unnamed protein product, partial [Ascophyllum nodosum]
MLSAGRGPWTFAFLAAVIALVTATATPKLSAYRGGEDLLTNFRALDTAAEPSLDEGLLIEPIGIPFLQEN